MKEQVSKMGNRTRAALLVELTFDGDVHTITIGAPLEISSLGSMASHTALSNIQTNARIKASALPTATPDESV